MYFGSVRFFRHLIITVVLLLIVIPIVLCVSINIKSKEKDKEIQRLTNANAALSSLAEYYEGSTVLGLEEIYNILQDLGIDNSELVGLIYEKDKSAFDKIMDTSVQTLPASSGNIDTVSTQQTTAVTIETPSLTTVEEEVKLPPYAELYPHLYSDVVIDGTYDKDDNVIYLTFDDGPSIYTNDVLNYLEKWGIKASFFVQPDESEECAAYLKRMLDNGYSVGIHTYSHVYTDIYKSVESYLEDFNQAFNLIYEQTGFKPYLFRFPGGSYNDYNNGIADEIIEEMTRRGFVYFDWNVDSEDSLGSDWYSMYNRVLDQISTNNRSVVLFHDGPSSKNMVYVLEDLIREISNRGYTFDAINTTTKPIQF